MPTWPSTLPQQPLVDGYNIVLPDLRLPSQMATGPAKVRRRNTWAPEKHICPYILTTAQKTILTDFYQDDLVEGTLQFVFPIPVVGGTANFRFDPEEPPPSFDPVDKAYWAVTITLDKMS